MGIATVMMKTTMKPAPMMEEIAVDLESINITAQNAYALKEEKEEAVELQLVKAAFRVGLEMSIVMIATII